MGIEGITLVDSPGSFRSRDAFFGNDRQEHQSAKKKRGPPTKAARYCFDQPNTKMSPLGTRAALRCGGDHIVYELQPIGHAQASDVVPAGRGEERRIGPKGYYPPAVRAKNCGLVVERA